MILSPENIKQAIEEATPKDGFNLCTVDQITYEIDIEHWYKTKEEAEAAQKSPEYKNQKTVIYGSQPAT